ncbi:hypothetical protein GQ53DRAFT_616473, partial [Thozetella sp. PMI_491]
SLSADQKSQFLISLRFDQLDSRQLNIRNAHSKTCKWILNNVEYTGWLDQSTQGEHHGLLWIKGHPGTGKSTLMKFVVSDTRRKLRGATVISFFFNARGNHLEKSTLGMYRSILLQLLERLPELQCVLQSLELDMGSGGDYQWSVELLKTLFEQAVQSLGLRRVVCFIDALDECEEGQVRDMMSFFEHLCESTTTQGIRFQVCFASRHYPHISVAKAAGLTLEGQQGHSQDIITYLESELKIGHSKLAEKVRAELQRKAAGVFMWVVLVTEMLNKEYDAGRVYALQKRIEEIPADLHELLRNILTRDDLHRDELLLCIQWVLFARKPLRPEQLYSAILSGVSPEAISTWDPDLNTAATMERFIISSSKGLAEVTRSRLPTVQFIHESIKDFLLKQDGWKEIWPDFEGSFRGTSHNRLKLCCLKYISIGATELGITDSSSQIPPSKLTGEALGAARQLADTAFPFLRYAVTNILHHADAAEGEGVDQKHFVEAFPPAAWLELDILLERHEIRRHSPTVSLLYLLAENNFTHLIPLVTSKTACFKPEGERYGMPIFAAVATGSQEAVVALLKIQGEMHPPESSLRGLYKRCDQGAIRRLCYRRNIRFSRTQSASEFILRLEDEALTALYIASSEFDSKERSKEGYNPLHQAARNSHEILVELLLDRGADIEARDNSLGYTPLRMAVLKGSESVVRLLLDRGADIEAKDSNGYTPLRGAVDNKNELMVRFL